MRQLLNNKGKILCFSSRITKAIGKAYDYPLTIVEAPMGYGKTTAVRECITLSNPNLLWQNVYDDSKTFFWSDSCRLIEEMDNELAHNLMKLGFPDDHISMHAALELIKNIAFLKRTVIVIDDFHLIDTQEMADFITFVAVNEIENLHIVLISRFFEFFNTEEMSLKGYLHHIKKDAFEFSREEIIDYYKCCEISLTESDADELHKLTEGWISALYLFMLNFKEERGLLTSTNIYKLVDQVIYNPFPERVKEFLLSMSIFNFFTLEQASYMMPDADIGEMINEVTGGNAFVMYDPIREAYHIHSILKNYLSNMLKLMRDSFQTELYKKAAEWYIHTGDYFLSMRYSYVSGNFDLLLRSLELDKGKSITPEHRELFIKYYNACPESDKINHPYAVLVYARYMFLFNNPSLFRKSCDLFMTIYQNIGSDDIIYKNKLLGEYEILMSLSKYNDIEKMSECFKRAYKLLREPSKILEKTILTYGSPSILYLFHRKSGKLLKEVQIMREAMPYYIQLTGNHGRGADEIMSAERFYHMGDFQNAEIDIHKAYQSSAEASDLMICTIFLDIKLSFMKGDYAGILMLFQKLYDYTPEMPHYVFLHTIDICETYIYCSLDMNEKVAAWIRNGEFPRVQLPFPSFTYLNIVYGRVLLMNGEYEKLLGNAEQLLNTNCASPNLLAQIYMHIYSAAADIHLSRAEDAAAALEQALCIAMPDQIYMPFVENGSAIKSVLEELRTQNIYADDIAEILLLYRQYHEAHHMIKRHITRGKMALTERESEVAQLAAQGLSNKEIGERLYISENTVKTQLKSVFAKLDINSRILLEQRLKM